jgi:hypothetical protein
MNNKLIMKIKYKIIFFNKQRMKVEINKLNKKMSLVT